MCKGRTIHLTGCGHDIYSWSERCERDCSVPRGPTYLLEDCCATCHPEHQSCKIRQDYDKTNEELISRMEEATRTGDCEVAMRTSEQIMSLNVAMREEQYKVKLKRIFSALDPEYPPAVDMVRLGMDSEWVDGKCIWTDPADDSKTLRRTPTVPEWLPAPGEDEDSLTAEYGDDESDTETVVPEKEEELIFIANEEVKADTSEDVHDDGTEEFWLNMADLQSDATETVRPAPPPPAESPRRRSKFVLSPRARVCIPQKNPEPNATGATSPSTCPLKYSRAAELRLKPYVSGVTNLSVALEACRASRKELKVKSSVPSVSNSLSPVESSPGASESSRTMHLRPYIPGVSGPSNSAEATSRSSRSRHVN